MRDHPAIENAIKTGYPHGEPSYPRCPVCGSECDEIYMDRHSNEILGCDVCAKVKNAWEVEECF